jgi:hypothetical protein
MSDGGAPEDFARLVQHVLIHENGLRPHALADALGLSYQALHARLSGKVAFMPLELRQLFLAFPDPLLATRAFPVIQAGRRP